MNIMDVIQDAIVGPAKEKLKNELLESMDRCSRILVVTKLIAEKMNLFDSVTYTDILNRYADKHFEAAKTMSPEELLEYMAEGVKRNDTENV